MLVVDDDRRLRALLSSYLVKNGHRVTVAATRAEARAFLDGLAFDIIVLDVMMPGESGFELATDLRGRSQVPILMLTARGEPQDRVRGLEIGVDDYLSKPFEPREFLLRIGSVLRRTRAAPFGATESAVVRFGRFAFSLERGELRAGEGTCASPNVSAKWMRWWAARNPSSNHDRGSPSGALRYTRSTVSTAMRLAWPPGRLHTRPCHLQ